MAASANRARDAETPSFVRSSGNAALGGAGAAKNKK
jgi:hypothetical protein